VKREHTQTVSFSIYEVRAIGICVMIARESGRLRPFLQSLVDHEEEAIFLAGMRSALVKLSDLEGKFPDVELTTQERLDIAAARAEVDQEKATIVDPRRDP
jgi:hypothetical protein